MNMLTWHMHEYVICEHITVNVTYSWICWHGICTWHMNIHKYVTCMCHMWTHNRKFHSQLHDLNGLFTYIHTYIHTYILHWYIHVFVYYLHIYTCIYSHTYIYIYTCVFMYTYSYIQRNFMYGSNGLFVHITYMRIYA